MTLNLNKKLFSIKLVSLEDSETLLRWRNSDAVRKFMYTDHLIKSEEHKIWLDKVINNDKYKSLILSYDGVQIGYFGFYDIDINNSKASWTFHMGDNENTPRGSGGAMEYFAMEYFFNEMKLNKLCCEVLSFNPNVIRLHKKFGYLEEGVLKNHFMRDEKFYDVHILAIFKDVWNIESLKSDEFLFSKK